MSRTASETSIFTSSLHLLSSGHMASTCSSFTMPLSWTTTVAMWLQSFFPSLVLEVKSWFCSPYGSSTGNYLVDFLFFHHNRHSHNVRILARPVLESSNPFFHHLVDFFLFCGWVQVFVTRMFFHFAGEKTCPIPVPRDRPLLYQFLSSYL